MNLSPEYKRKRNEFLRAEEGCRLWVYDDATGKRLSPGQRCKGFRTIGVGDNLDRKGGLTAFANNLSMTAEAAKAVYSGEAPITQEQADVLLDIRAEEFERTYERKFGDLNFPDNKRIAVLSMLFNGGEGLVGPNTTQAIRTLDTPAIANLIENISRKKNPVLNGRRKREADLFRGN